MSKLASLNDYEALEDDLAEAKERIKELEEELEDVTFDLEYEKAERLKYENAATVLKELLEAEKKADELEAETKHDLAYDVFHILRQATATLHDIVYPSVKVTETINVGDMTVRLTTMVPQ